MSGAKSMDELIEETNAELRRNPFAFPVSTVDGYTNEGMTLRDAFALAIAGGMAAHSGTQGGSFGPGEIATRSYEIANALLKERKLQ